MNKTSHFQNFPAEERPRMNFPELAVFAKFPEDRNRNSYDDLQRSNEQLREHAATLQAQNAEQEPCVHMVAHNLKDPLTVMIVTSDLITDIPDLTHQELRENMQQIRSTAYEMNSIINNLLLFAKVPHVALLIEPVDMAKAVVNVRNRLSYMIKKQQAQVIIPESWLDAIGFGP